MRHTFRQLIFFTAVGSLAAVVDFGLYLSLTRLTPFFATHFILASVISATTALSVAYFNNRRWTFRMRHRRGVVPYSRFLGVYALGIFWQNLFLAALVGLGAVDWLAKGMAILIVAYGWNFLLAKYWVFGYNVDNSSV